MSLSNEAKSSGAFSRILCLIYHHSQLKPLSKTILYSKRLGNYIINTSFYFFIPPAYL